MRQRERVTLNQVSAPNRKVSAALAGNRKSTIHRNFSGIEKLLALQRTHGNAFVQRLVRSSLIPGVVARQPKPPDPGWSDAPKKGLNELVTTVDEKGNIVPGTAAGKGVWRIPLEDLGHGFQ